MAGISRMRRRKQAGFTFLELMFVIVIALILVALAVPWFTETLRSFRIAGDARDINGDLLLAKMRAAANFTATRIRFDYDNRRFVSEMWCKTADSFVGCDAGVINTWVPVGVGGPQTLASDVNFGVGSATEDPSGAAITEPPHCNDGDPTAAASWPPGGGSDTAGNNLCIVFNSRGFPVDTSGALAGAQAVYINDGNTVEGVTVSATGLTAVYRASSATEWFRH